MKINNNISSKSANFKLKSAWNAKLAESIIKIVKKSTYRLLLIFAFICVMSINIGCSSKDTTGKEAVMTAQEEAAADSQPDAEITKEHMPQFTEVTFDTKEDEMLKLYSEPKETYPSLYNGTVYVFSGCDYKGHNGFVKYMTDDNGNIACISWLCESDDTEDIEKTFADIHEGLVNILGSSENRSESQGNFGDAWYFDDVHIMVDAVITSDYKGMQLSYLKAEYSKKDIVDKKRQEREQED